MTSAQLIESILHQTYKDYELLLIDDGSIDSSAEICLEYANLDIRIKYYKKCNSGVSSTRNFGFEVAKGRWLMFIDSDDNLPSQAVRRYTIVYSVIKHILTYIIFNVY